VGVEVPVGAGSDCGAAASLFWAGAVVVVVVGATVVDVLVGDVVCCAV
jgi:hypothetical protein